MRKIIFVFIGILIATNIYADEIPLADFAKGTEYFNATLSPTGEYIAIERAADQGKKLVAVVRTKDLKLMSHIPATTSVSPFNPVWVTDDRIVVQFTEDFDSREHEIPNGELMSLDVKKERTTRLIEHVAFWSNGEREADNRLNGFAQVIHLLPKEKDYVLIRFSEFDFTRTGYIPNLYKLNTKTGRVKFVAEAPSYQAHFILSVEGDLLYSIGFDAKAIKEENKLVTHQYSDGNWKPLTDVKLEAERFVIVAATDKTSEVIIRAEISSGPDKLYRYNLESGESETIFAHPVVDPQSVEIDPETNRIIAVHFEAGYPDIHLVDTDHIFSQWYPALFQAFGGKRVRITSASDDGQKLLVHVSGATEPGQFHLFDTKAKKFTYLFNARSWIEPEQLANTEPFTMKARDGVGLYGYLTLPKNAKDKRPLVVLPHGGPHMRDWWYFDPTVQFLASRGYAVLQVNFRGSSGFGRAFETAGFKKWGSDIQQDIIDATRWATAHTSIDKDRVCIMGYSFGGYSALMSPILEPDLYKCGIGIVGVYDLELLWTTGDAEQMRWGENYLKDTIGENTDSLKNFSPSHRVAELKAPIFIAHGAKDHRADVEHFKVMKAALEKAEHPHEAMLVEKEGHGFASEQNRAELYARIEKFLDRYIGNSGK